MKTVLLRAMLFGLGVTALAGAAQAHDLSQDEALRLSKEGVIRPFEEILPAALSRYPGSRLLEAELERSTATTFTKWSCSPSTVWCANWNWMPATAASSRIRKTTDAPVAG